MATPPRKRSGPDARTFTPRGMKLKQIQFRSYLPDIAIYHFQAYYLTLPKFRSLLTRKQHGYVATLLGVDPMLNLSIPDGDETPHGCIEVGYLPGVFQHGGSALGFRVGGGVAEWLCFDRPMSVEVLQGLDIDVQSPTGAMVLFDLVGTLAKGISTRRVRGAHQEYKLWFDSLARAGHRRVKLQLRWRAFGKEATRDCRERRGEMGEDEEMYLAREMEGMHMGADDTGGVEEYRDDDDDTACEDFDTTSGTLEPHNPNFGAPFQHSRETAHAPAKTHFSQHLSFQEQGQYQSKL